MRRADCRPNVIGEPHLGRSGEVVGDRAEALVRVDAASSGLRDRGRPFEGQAGRMRE
jgi:hypothetical protein